jgi:hypothetical protein
MTEKLLHAHSKSIARLIECTRNTLRQKPDVRSVSSPILALKLNVTYTLYYSQHGETKSSLARGMTQRVHRVPIPDAEL